MLLRKKFHYIIFYYLIHITLVAPNKYSIVVILSPLLKAHHSYKVLRKYFSKVPHYKDVKLMLLLKVFNDPRGLKIPIWKVWTGKPIAAFI